LVGIAVEGSKSKFAHANPCEKAASPVRGTTSLIANREQVRAIKTQTSAKEMVRDMKC